MGLTTSEPSVPGGVLAIDAGNSKTDVVIVAADGSVLGTARGGGFHPHRIGAAKAVAGLAPLVALAAHGAGLAPDGGPLVEQVSACLANADFPVEEQRLELALHGYGWGRRTQVANDTFAILRAGVAEPRGVAVVCGAGINCVGMLPDGRTARFPAVGRISGDWGGGAELAEEALWWAARAEDGRGEPTALAAVLPAHFGLGSMYALIEALHLQEIAATRKHEMVPPLFRVAAEGDPVAVRIVRRQADEVVALASVALDRLGLLAEEAAVVLGGGVLAARHPLLMDSIADRLAAAAPKAVPRVVTAPPVLGAALLGLDRLAASDGVRARLRRHYEADAPQRAET
ncbi:N-acetylglucosamine kinase [Streptomyces silvisoli]|uniref:BadF/BadG/BcrA/BcrD ATPase family protein n=1 Tax=Streptomyces silvisoli TaxID=3034235 RepID=A0ABT5ZN48_9ACTN|nr:BadF/BadG/BcrA/BcrD ATPase family protein [Streptomyces silvisoli]MDF3291255.1 BadF/BadG/BcrA/BcrD ATPase family protein [Streptomyces silvisoli]